MNRSQSLAFIAGAMVVLGLGLAGGCGNATPAASAGVSPTAAPMPGYTYVTTAPLATSYAAPAEVTPPAPVYPLTSFGSGTYLIGSEVTPGRYVTEGATSCYWEVQRENPNAYGSKIIENGNANGHTNITIPKNAYAIEIMSYGDGCTFTRR